MIVDMQWTEGMNFRGSTDGHLVPMDAKAPIGKNTAPTPKELVALGLGGCTAMDVIALLKKYKQLPTQFKVSVDIETSTGVQPAIFVKATILYQAEGQIEAEKLLEAVRLSQTRFCGVSAMMTKSFPITFKVQLNGSEIGSGQASFTEQGVL